MSTQPNPHRSAARAASDEIIGRLAHRLGQPWFPRGELAGLRRLDTETPIAPVFLRLRSEYEFGSDHLGNNGLSRWALILRGMALMVPHHHDPKTHLGTALFAADYKEQRLARLLNTHGAQFQALVPRLCRQLAAARQPCDWREFGRLILHEGGNEPCADKARLEIARFYFDAEARAERQSD